MVWANDIDPEAIAVFKRNATHFGGATDEVAVCSDVWDLLDKGFEFPEADVVTGGFPCQGFSLAGRRDLDDSRNRLYLAMKEVIRRSRPRAFVAENVRGLHNIAGGGVLQRIEEALGELGYSVRTYLVNAADFGVPQKRERLFIVGFRDTNAHLSLTPTHRPISESEEDSSQLGLMADTAGANGTSSYVTVREAIGDLEHLPLGAFPDHSCGVRYPDWYDQVAPYIGVGQRLYNFRQDPTLDK